MFKTMIGILLLCMVASCTASAPAFAHRHIHHNVGGHGWSSVHRYVHPHGGCWGSEVLISNYGSGHKTSNGERFDWHGLTAATCGGHDLRHPGPCDYPIGTHLTIMNPETGQSVMVRVNDRGPWYTAWDQGVRIDITTGAARRIGMKHAIYACVN